MVTRALIALRSWVRLLVKANIPRFNAVVLLLVVGDVFVDRWS